MRKQNDVKITVMDLVNLVLLIGAAWVCYLVLSVKYWVPKVYRRVRLFVDGR